MRSGFRIVKPRTERQQEAADSYKTRPDSVVAILPRDVGMPVSSWWTDCTREEFHDRQVREQARIGLSRFGRQLVVVD